MLECHLLAARSISLHDTTLPEIDVFGLCHVLKESPRGQRFIPIV